MRDRSETRPGSWLRAPVFLVVAGLAIVACHAGSGASGSTGAASSVTTAGPPANSHPPSTVPPDDCAPAHRGLAPGSHSFPFDGQTRTYLLALPPGATGRRFVPLVFDFHGFASNGPEQDARTQLSAKGTALGYAVVTPDALGRPSQFNMFGTPGQPDDYGFVHALAAELQRQLCIDPHRIYAAGHSNGSAFTGFVACQKPYLFAAIAMVSATPPSTCPPAQAPSVLSIHGSDDPQVPYGGGAVGGGPVRSPSVPQTIARYAKDDGCPSPGRHDTPHPGVDRVRYTGCPGGREVVLDTVEGGTHAWPGSSAATADPTDSAAGRTFAATDAILAFFGHHRRP